MMISRDQVYASRYLAGRVKRYSTWPMLQAQSVGEHCWGVACIYVEVFGLPRSEVLYYCLHHDSGELWSGDLPFGTKLKVNGLKDRMEEAEAIGLQKLEIRLPDLLLIERVQVKISDLLEMYETGKHEVNLGNNYAYPIMHDTSSAAQKIAAQHGLSNKVNDWLRRNS